MGFNAKMAGLRSFEGAYRGLGIWTVYWSSTPYINDHAFVAILAIDSSGIEQAGQDMFSASSVRYVRE
jgi:hypothetical protein